MVVAWLVVGIVAGFLAGKVMKGDGYGLMADLLAALRRTLRSPHLGLERGKGERQRPDRPSSEVPRRRRRRTAGQRPPSQWMMHLGSAVLSSFTFAAVTFVFSR